MASRVVASWGHVLRAPHVVYELHSRYDAFPLPPDGGTVLPYGNGRSYGDSCLNVGGALVRFRAVAGADEAFPSAEELARIEVAGSGRLGLGLNEESEE